MKTFLKLMVPLMVDAVIVALQARALKTESPIDDKFVAVLQEERTALIQDITDEI